MFLSVPESANGHLQKTSLAQDASLVGSDFARVVKAGRAVRRRLFTPREVEVLHWIANGKSDWQVGQILMISHKTVNYHVERAKRKLKVCTRMQAVFAAAECGLVQMPVLGLMAGQRALV